MDARRQDDPDVRRHQGVLVDPRREWLDRGARRLSAQSWRGIAACGVAQRRRARYRGGGTWAEKIMLVRLRHTTIDKSAATARIALPAYNPGGVNEKT